MSNKHKIANKDNSTTTPMPYVNLGRTGLKVSRLSYGNYVNSKKDAHELSNQLIKSAFDQGINYFDTAEYYGFGEAERQIGEALRALGVPRSDFVLSTKIFGGKFPENIMLITTSAAPGNTSLKA